MSIFALELDDRALSLARDGKVLASTPSVVFDGTAGGTAGANAWSELRTRPTSTSSRHLGNLLMQKPSARAEPLVIAELRTRLAEQPRLAEDPVWIVTPARVEPRGLEAILGVTHSRSLELPVAGFVDSATAIAAALALDRSALVLELGLHHAAATAVDCEGGQARRRRTVLTERGGLIELHQAWLDLISTTMVKRTRFDPLHDALIEQRLFDAIPTLAREAEASGSTEVVVSKGAERLTITLTRDQLAQAAEPIYRALLALLHQLRSAGSVVAVIMPGKVVGLPGMHQLLEQFAGCELIGIPDGFAAAAVSQLDLPDPAQEPDSVRMLRRLPLQSAAPIMEMVNREELGRRRSGGPAPSHLLLDGRAYSLNTDSLIVGRASGGVQLPEGLAGVSRRHCTFVRDAEELVLLDHSKFGTFVNGERVQERVRVYAGDRVRVGEPGVELSLIAVGEIPATHLT